MDIVIGPVLKRPGGYGFDVWTAARGLTRGYPYCRIEDAYYAWRAEIRASAQGRAPAAKVCQTLGVNAGEKMHQRAGVKLHHGWMPNAPTGGLLLRDKQDEKRIASPANVRETSSAT